MNILRCDSNRRRIRRWAAACLVGLSAVWGCKAEQHEQHKYTVRIQNNSGADLNELKVTFEKPDWSFPFGFVGNGNNAGYVTDSMPAPPSSVLMQWQDAEGKTKSARIEVGEDVKKDILQHARMSITVMPAGAVTVK